MLEPLEAVLRDLEREEVDAVLIGGDAVSGDRVVETVAEGAFRVGGRCEGGFPGGAVGLRGHGAQELHDVGGGNAVLGREARAVNP